MTRQTLVMPVSTSLALAGVVATRGPTGRLSVNRL